MAYLQIDHVDKTFRRGAQETEVLTDITVGIEKGEYVSIIGHSGLRQVHAAQHRRRPHRR